MHQGLDNVKASRTQDNKIRKQLCLDSGTWVKDGIRVALGWVKIKKKKEAKPIVIAL